MQGAYFIAVLLLLAGILLEIIGAILISFNAFFIMVGVDMIYTTIWLCSVGLALILIYSIIVVVKYFIDNKRG